MNKLASTLVAAAFAFTAFGVQAASHAGAAPAMAASAPMKKKAKAAHKKASAPMKKASAGK